MKLENNLGKDDIKQLVFRLAIPSMLAQFVSVMYSIVDRMYIGNIPEVGEIALAGVGICGPIVTLISSFASLVGIGGAPYMSIRLGEKNEDYAKQILANCFLMLSGLSVVLTIVFLLLKSHLLQWFGASAVTFPYANSYMTIYVAGTAFAILSLGMNQFIICQGYSLTGMKSVVLGAVVNIVLDPIFIFVFNMGVQGAALATVISQLASCIYVLRFLFSDKIPVKITFKGYSWPICQRVLQLGFSPFFIIAFDNILIITMNTVLQKYGGPGEGDMLVTCATVIQSFMLMVTMPLGGISGGTQPVVAFNFGAKDRKRVLKGQRETVKLALLFTTVMFILANTASVYFVRIFTKNPEYIKLCVWGIRIYTLGIIPLGAQYTIVDGFIAMGEAKLAMFLSFFRKFLYFGCVFVLPMVWGARSTFYTEPIVDFAGPALSILLYIFCIKRILDNRMNAKVAVVKKK